MKKFNAKLLLFGEYGIIYEGHALAIPFSHFGGRLKFPEGKEHRKKIQESQQELGSFISRFFHLDVSFRLNFPLNEKEIIKDMGEGLFFDSDIPVGYGTGSSGALCAALYQKYSTLPAAFRDDPLKAADLKKIKNDLAVMESSFHGKSSGIDPLVSFLNRSVLFRSSNIELPPLDFSRNRFSAYLIDTGSTSTTSPLVRLFMEKMRNPEFVNRVKTEYIEAGNLAIQAFLNGNHDTLFTQLKKISAFQLNHLPEMIPTGFRDFFDHCLDSNMPVKFLGSGGGGFLMAFVPSGHHLPENIKKIKIV